MWLLFSYFLSLTIWLTLFFIFKSPCQLTKRKEQVYDKLKEIEKKINKSIVKLEKQK